MFASSSSWASTSRSFGPVIASSSNSKGRTFTSSSQCLRNLNHYEVLGVNKGASKMEIKSNYFRLSKLYHPDTTTEVNAKEKFHKVSEAYQVLSDDRQRRAYDRTLLPPHGKPTYAHSSHNLHNTYQGPWTYDPDLMYETRKKGATHAWESHRSRRSTPHQQPFQHPRTSRPPFNEFNDPFTSSNVRRATGFQPKLSRREARAEAERQEHDRLTQESTLVRFVQVLGVVFFVACLGGWSANAK